MKKLLAFIIMILVSGIVMINLTGCKDNSTEDIVKTDAEYKDQAEKEINKENMLDELDKLEKSVEEDTE